MVASGCRRILCAVVVGVVLATGCARVDRAAGMPDEEYCDQVRTVEAAAGAHLAAFLEIGARSGPADGAELARLSSQVADAAEEARRLGGVEASSDWAVFERLYRVQARTLERTRPPFDAILDLEEGAVEWSAVHDSVSDVLGNHVHLWCAFHPDLGG